MRIVGDLTSHTLHTSHFRTFALRTSLDLLASLHSTHRTLVQCFIHPHKPEFLPSLSSSRNLPDKLLATNDSWTIPSLSSSSSSSSFSLSIEHCSLNVYVDKPPSNVFLPYSCANITPETDLQSSHTNTQILRDMERYSSESGDDHEYGEDHDHSHTGTHEQSQSRERERATGDETAPKRKRLTQACDPCRKKKIKCGRCSMVVGHPEYRRQ